MIFKTREFVGWDQRLASRAGPPSRLNVSPLVGRRSQSSLVPPYGKLRRTFIFQQLKLTRTPSSWIVNNGT